MRALALLFLLAGAPFEVADAPKPPKAVRPPGKVVKSVRFRDEGGEKLVVLTKRETTTANGGSTYLYATYAAKTKAGWKTLRTTKDWQKDCEFDLVVGFRDAAFSVTDVDGDGQAEVTFAYDVDCVSDVSPTNLKLIVLEGEAKYAVRGTKRVQVSEDDFIGGDAKYDESFAKAPKLKAHAEKVWAKISGH